MMSHVAHYPFVSFTTSSSLLSGSHLLAAPTRRRRGPSPPLSSGSGAIRGGLGLRHRWRASSPPSSDGGGTGRGGIALQPQHTDSNAASTSSPTWVATRLAGSLQMKCKSMCPEGRVWDLGIMSGVRTHDRKHSKKVKRL